MPISSIVKPANIKNPSEIRRCYPIYWHHDDTSIKNQDRNAATSYNGHDDFLKYFLPQGTPQNLRAPLVGLVSCEVIWKLFIIPF